MRVVVVVEVVVAVVAVAVIVMIVVVVAQGVTATQCLSAAARAQGVKTTQMHKCYSSNARRQKREGG